MKPKICFVTYEFFPTTRGGVGVLLANLSRALVVNGHQVVVLLDIPRNEFEQFQQTDRLTIGGPQQIRGYLAEDLCDDLELDEGDFDNHYAWRSYRLHNACSKVYQIEHPDVIEFVDYCGAAYFALVAKLAGLAYATSHIAVRLHTSIEIMDAQEAIQPITDERYKLYALEHAALELAETILYPSHSFLERAYRPNYGNWFGHTAISTPPLLKIPQLQPAAESADIVLYYGRLFGLKGVDRFVDAAILYLNNPSNPRLRFFLAGYDSHRAPGGNGSYQHYLLDRIPKHLHSAFVFMGHIDENGLRTLSANILCAVFPNYFESFCYAAHELYAAGIPLIVSPIAAFSDFFVHEQNALVFDGTAHDLSKMIARLQGDAILRRRLQRPFSVATSQPGDFYATAPASSWMTSASANPEALRILIVMLCDDHEPTQDQKSTAQTLPGRVVLLKRRSANAPHVGNEVFFLGELRLAFDPSGSPINVFEPFGENTILVVREGDEIEPEFIERGLQILSRYPQIGYVDAWSVHGHEEPAHIRTGSLSLEPELGPLRQQEIPLRVILRIPSSRLLAEVFDPRLGPAGEIGAIWGLEARGQRGVSIPKVLVQTAKALEAPLRPREIGFLILNRCSPRTRDRLVRYLAILHGSIPDFTEVESARARLNQVETELRQIEASIGWKVTVGTRRLRRKILDGLSSDRIGRRIVSAWMKLREWLVSRPEITPPGQRDR